MCFPLWFGTCEGESVEERQGGEDPDSLVPRKVEVSGLVREEEKRVGG